jgi:hypothetical protein
MINGGLTAPASATGIPNVKLTPDTRVVVVTSGLMVTTIVALSVEGVERGLKEA